MTSLQKLINQMSQFAMNAAHPSSALSNLRSAKFRSWPLLLDFALVISNPLATSSVVGQSEALFSSGPTRFAWIVNKTLFE